MDARSTGVILNRESHSEVRSSHLFYASNFQTQSQTVIVSPSAPVFTTHDQNIIADVNAGPRPTAFNIPQQGQGEAAWTVHGQSPRDPIAPSEPPPPYSEVDKLPSALPATNPPAYRQHENSTMAHAQHTTSMGSVTQKPFKLKKAYLKSNLAVLKVLEFIVCLVGFSSCAHFRNSIFGHLKSDVTGFFMFMVIAIWLFVLVVFWLNLISFMDLIDTKASHIKMLVAHAVLAFMLLIASSVMADMDMTIVCDWSHYYRSICNSYRTAVACGFITTAIMCFDSAIQFFNISSRN
eukprot:Seg1970.8 transcript_id=Seg1970.8/GoldUCD/mRNA.D3Y31 product="hypothetical protein" protein_id=Seg1970.8/GoldUCD/D3Y31